VTKKVVYQTLEDRENPDYIESDGPFPCKRLNAWLGEGFYFWDTFIENAHWWGSEGANYNDGYVICKSECDFTDEKCFDLVGNTEHILEFAKAIKLMKEKGLYNDQTTVARIIYHLKDVLKMFNYEASRVYGVKSKLLNSKFSACINFLPSKPQYLDILPAIQICFYKKKSLNLRNYKIVFPDEYIDGYGI